ncbi:unnamed protein product [Acanthoscelides obtectus]|uniref:AN1-type domain-containing protein n=1 Tax=Acanthoscelides obtectus TaxID=200917 RepID=A0A9P0KPR8_ACAOB|nr:unnamed protein product [Acanthoscelides obtectus]CAK1657347.1 AN1-type zinc finger protein 1 [Acanthoscelides obtectus]
MELPSLGKQCAEPTCLQLDFLPLNCKCGQIFCSDHFKVHTQICQVSKNLTEDELKQIENVFVCSHSNCNERSVVPLVCERCHKHFCIKHRHLTGCEEKSAEKLAAEKERYAAPVRRFNEVKDIVDKQGKATGVKSIAQMNRLYFSVSKIDGNTEKAVAVFVSNQWSLGRAIDSIADEMKLQNNNNKSGEKKLRLFKKEDKEILTQNMSVNLSALLEDNIIVDGDSLIIEYVDDDCIKL